MVDMMPCLLLFGVDLADQLGKVEHEPAYLEMSDPESHLTPCLQA